LSKFPNPGRYHGERRHEYGVWVVFMLISILLLLGWRSYQEGAPTSHHLWPANHA
jgi:hypothetical protein